MMTLICKQVDCRFSACSQPQLSEDQETKIIDSLKGSFPHHACDISTFPAFREISSSIHACVQRQQALSAVGLLFALKFGHTMSIPFYTPSSRLKSEEGNFTDYSHGPQLEGYIDPYRSLHPQPPTKE
jgi:hypothetical protein